MVARYLLAGAVIAATASCTPPDFVPMTPAMKTAGRFTHLGADGPGYPVSRGESQAPARGRPDALASSAPSTTLAVEPPVPPGDGQMSEGVDVGYSPARSAPSDAIVSYYGYELAGHNMADGSPFDPEDFTFAHRTLPFGTRVLFEGPGGSVVARCTDRGPVFPDRDFDLSLAAMRAVGGIDAGVLEVVAWRLT